MDPLSWGGGVMQVARGRSLQPPVGATHPVRHEALCASPEHSPHTTYYPQLARPPSIGTPPATRSCTSRERSTSLIRL